MRIAIFTDTYLPDRNGASSSIDHYTRLLADDGHQIMIFCPKCGLYKDIKYPNISVKRYVSITAPSYKDFRLALPFIWTAVRDLKAFNPDIVHVQTPLGIGWMGIWATKILKIKNIQTYHTYIPDFLMYIKPKALLGINKIMKYINSDKLQKTLENVDIEKANRQPTEIKNNLDKIAKEVGATVPAPKVNKFNERFGRDYTRLIYNRADLVLTPSLAMKKVLKKQGVQVKVEVMSNGIDYEYFKKKTDYTFKNKMIVIGRLGFEKSVDIVVEAFAIASKTNPKLRLDIFGDGPARRPLKMLAKKLNVNNKIKFFGRYDIAKVSQQLYNYDFFVTASAIETEGIVILEAMASGLPILGVRKLAVPDIVKHGVNGYLSKPFDPAEMAKNMLKIMESEKVLARMGREALKVAKAHEVRVCKERLVGFYKQMMKQ